jgi:hypothetical protein
MALVRNSTSTFSGDGFIVQHGEPTGATFPHIGTRRAQLTGGLGSFTARRGSFETSTQ